MRVFPEKFEPGLYITGLAFIIVSLFFYLVPFYQHASTWRTHDNMFIVNFVIAALYFFILWFGGILGKNREGRHHMMLFLVLFLISAYSLNREIPVFEASATWFTILLILVCVNYLSFPYFDSMPGWVRTITSFIAGIGMVVFSYLALYLMPVYPYGLIGVVALGLGTHAFVPLLFCLYTGRVILRASTDTKRFVKVFLSAIGACLLVIIVYTITWAQQLAVINGASGYASITANDNLPSWIRVAQKIPENSVSEKILKTDLVYSTAKLDDSFFGFGSRGFENRIHDPLVMIATFFCQKPNINDDDKVKILESMYDARHQAEDRLWSGRNLKTEHITSSIGLWPAHRISYTDMQVVVANTGETTGWNREQEALYTFHLPEGGVVTSLSLWINGREEKGILTTKSKADAAYKTIVGRERRDPSVVHWKEGNTVTVRVFPVLAGESRKFRLGVTAPMRFSEQELSYSNIWFDGPPSDGTKEDISVSIKDNSKLVSIPAIFNENNGSLIRSHKPYTRYWSVVTNVPAISSAGFVFDGQKYQVISAGNESETFAPENIYLDINKSWSVDEIDAVLNLVKAKKVYISDGTDAPVLLTAANTRRLIGQLHSNNFSLFPFYKIADPSTSLVITKQGSLSPSIADLRNSLFLNTLSNYFSDGRRIHLFNIGRERAPFLGSMKEFRMFIYQSGDIVQLKNTINTKTFTAVKENENLVAYTDAGISLQRTPVGADSAGSIARGSEAPDHLMRLFAYSNIMQQAGSGMLRDTLTEDQLITEAEKANIVSPFSSLIVLETQKDYDRFDIKASKDSLGNAAASSTGAVPEPHEWALILLVLCICGWLKFRNNKQSA